MAEGHETPANGPELRPPAPHLGGPLGSSGAAPQELAATGPEKPATRSAAAERVEHEAAGPGPAEPTPAAAASPAPESSPAPEPKQAAEPTPATAPKQAAEPTPTTEPSPATAPKQAAEPTPPAEPAPAAEPTPLAEAGQAAAVKQAPETNPPTGPKPVTDPKPAAETQPAAEPDAVAGATAAADAKAAADPKAAANAKAAAADPKAAAEAKAAAETEVGAAAKSSGAGEGGKAGTGDSGLAQTKVGEIDLDKPAVVTVTSASGRRVTQVLRHANPIRAARTAGRTTHAWAKRPTGRLLVPAIIAVLLIGAAGTAGAYLVPQALEAASSPSATPGFPLDGAAAGPSAASVAPAPSAPPLSGTAPTFPNVVGARPADALAGWAQGVGTRVAIPVVAVQAYGYAELVVTRTAPNCHLSWTTIAAIASVESSHGSANGAVLGADGSVQPPIYGLQLDGKGGRQLIRDTDQGLIDSDPAYDRAVGPLQFIPSTWNEMKVDADNSGAPDPNDIDDASLAAALYLCKGGRDLSKADAWWDAILSYNAVRPYAQKVFDTANEYGVRSRV